MGNWWFCFCRCYGIVLRDEASCDGRLWWKDAWAARALVFTSWGYSQGFASNLLDFVSIPNYTTAEHLCLVALDIGNIFKRYQKIELELAIGLFFLLRRLREKQNYCKSAIKREILVDYWVYLFLKLVAGFKVQLSMHFLW